MPNADELEMKIAYYSEMELPRRSRGDFADETVKLTRGLD